MNRRSLLRSALAFPVALANRASPSRAQDAAARFQYPIAWAGQRPGNGFFIRHGYGCENTWYNPGFVHTGEDWYAIDDRETAGADVVAIAQGTVVFADSDYPGRVVIVQHESGLFSMYGHLDYSLAVSEGDTVTTGQHLGAVLHRTDGRAPSHLHFEVRTFLTTPEVNGDQPRYGFACGPNCLPGPGYWPIDAPEHPSAIGWRNPTHVIARRMFNGGTAPAGFSVIVPDGIDEAAPVWSLPADRQQAEHVGEQRLAAGERFPLLQVAAGPEATDGRSAERYRLWYRIRLRDSEAGWVRAAIPSDFEVGSDGRPSTVRFVLAPASQP
jgi:murein DD-endopeptidase MepM/ murein hydrolase activator NlpD